MMKKMDVNSLIPMFLRKKILMACVYRVKKVEVVEGKQA